MKTEGEFNEWKQHPMTIEFMRILAGKRADLRNEWELCSISEYTKDEFVLGNVANLGMCKAYMYAEQFDYETYEMEISE